jgi:hypothetical protein
MSRRPPWLAAFFLTLAAAALPAALPALAQEGDDFDLKLSPPGPVVAGIPDPLAKRLCDALHALPEARKAACCNAGTATRGLAAECARVLSDALRAGRVALDPAAVARCERASAEAYAGCDWVTPLAPAAPAACRRLVAGVFAAGAPCDSALECQAGLACRAGVCASPGAAGAACGGAAADLLTLYTRQTAAAEHPDCDGYCSLDGRCARWVAVDGPCWSSQQCASGNHCAAGRCAAGAVASLGEPCTGSACGEGAICAAGRCVARKQAGETCSSPFECLATCNVAAGAGAGTCGMRCTALPLPTLDDARPAPQGAARPSGAVPGTRP